MSGLFGRGYPGGDTSRTVRFRSNSLTTKAVGTSDTVMPVFENVDTSDGPSLGFTKISNTVARSGPTAKSLTGLLIYNIATTGGVVTLRAWMEASPDNVTWAPVANSLSVVTIQTDATVDIGSAVVGFTQPNVYIRWVCQRTGGTTCNVQQETYAATTGSVTQPAILFKVYGI